MRRALAAALLIALPSAAAAQEWERYENPRFGTMVEVPAEGFAAGPAPANGDGQSWASPDGAARISVYGAFYNVMVDDFAAYREQTLTYERQAGLDVTYETGGDSWFVYSGYRGDEVVYVKVMRAESCVEDVSGPVAHHMRIEYPTVLRERYDGMIGHMEESFSPGAEGC